MIDRFKPPRATFQPVSLEKMEAQMRVAAAHMHSFDEELQRLLPGAKWHGGEIVLPDTAEARRVIDALTQKYFLQLDVPQQTLVEIRSQREGDWRVRPEGDK